MTLHPTDSHRCAVDEHLFCVWAWPCVCVRQRQVALGSGGRSAQRLRVWESGSVVFELIMSWVDPPSYRKLLERGQVRRN